jgi:hypothetical protein
MLVYYFVLIESPFKAEGLNPEIFKAVKQAENERSVELFIFFDFYH